MISLCLMMSLTSCVTLQAPPAQYLEACEVTYLPTGKATQGDLVRLAVSREYDVKLCNADKAALKAWYDGYCEAAGSRCRVKYGSKQ
jgi:hypothetical protein